MEGVLESYRVAQAWDEMFDDEGGPRPLYGAIVEALRPLETADLQFRADQLAKTFTERGVTYAFEGVSRPFPLDLIPRIIETEEWRFLAAGVRQRVRALEAFLDDAYGEGSIFAEGVVPKRLVTSSREFSRAGHNVASPNGVRIHVAGIDVVRDEMGQLRALEDNIRIPSGVSYVMENRRAITRTFPGLLAEQRILPVDEYPKRLLAALRASAPERDGDPTVVVLTPGIHNPAYFEHALLARRMGVELVEGRDLTCRNNRLFMKTTNGEQPVHVVYRRVDDEFLDPLHGQPSSMIGVAGLLNTARAGSVTIANAVGNGIADDKLMYTYLPEIIDFYLDEEPILKNVETYRLDEAEVLAEILDRLDQFVVKPVDGAGGAGIVFGPQASEVELFELRQQVSANPRGYIAQRPVALSTHPTLIEGRLVPRHIDLRPFAVNDGSEIWVLPGGLTRVALPEGALVVNSSQGGGSKDTWVLVDDGETEQLKAPPVEIQRAFEFASRQGGPSAMERTDQQ
jgi:uncharacterized circularly permuted ATP-grasp superfamily protein